MILHFNEVQWTIIPGARLGCTGAAPSEQDRSQFAVVKSTVHCSMLIPCWQHRPVLRLSFALGGVERIWQLVPVSQPCSPSHAITANIQSSRILAQFLWVWLSSSLLAFCTQQMFPGMVAALGGGFQPPLIPMLQSMS